MSTFPRFWLSALLLAVGAARVAHAAEPSRNAPPSEQEPAKEQAKQHFLRGLEFARKDQNYDAALAEFLASRELFPTQVALLNAAVSLTRLGRYDEALSMYQELFELFGPGMTAQERTLANEEMAELAGRLGSIAVDVDSSDALVEIDGRRRGSTPLSAPLPVGPGTHVVRVSKPHFEPFEARIVVASQQRRELRVTLQPSGAPAPARAAPAAAAPPARAPRPKAAVLHVGADVGVLLASSFNGGAAQACASPAQPQGTELAGCRDRKRPIGPLVHARIGYELRPGLELDVRLGYVSAREEMTRSIVANGDRERRYVSTDYRDSSQLSALTAALGVSYRASLRFPLTFALALGVARATLEHDNGGAFALSVPNPRNPDDVYVGTARASVPEAEQALWLPLLAPELRVALPVSSKLSFDVGVGVLLLFGSSALRSGDTSLSGAGQRRTGLAEVPGGFADGSDVQPGVLALPRERSIGTLLALTPSLGGRFEL